MKKLVALLLISLMATVAFANLDTDPNQLGIYFDADQDPYTMNDPDLSTVVGPSFPRYSDFLVYVVLTNTSAPVKGFEFSYDIVCNKTTGFNRTLELISGVGPINVGNSAGKFTGDYACGLAAPIPAAPAIVLVVWQFFHNSATAGLATMEFYLGQAVIPSMPGGLPVLDGGDGYGLRQAGVMSGQPGNRTTGLPVAALKTGAGIVSEETSSFGSVKSLFR